MLTDGVLDYNTLNLGIQCHKEESRGYQGCVYINVFYWSRMENDEALVCAPMHTQMVMAVWPKWLWRTIMYHRMYN